MQHNSSYYNNMNPAGRNNSSNEYTEEDLRRLTWDELLAEVPGADGSTRFPGDRVVMAFLKCNLNLHEAAKLVGYRGNSSGIAASVRFRLSRSGVGNILRLLTLLMRAGKMPKKCTQLLAKQRRPGKHAVAIANEIINRSTAKYNDLDEACRKLGIDYPTAAYWLAKA